MRRENTIACTRYLYINRGRDIPSGGPEYPAATDVLLHFFLQACNRLPGQHIGMCCTKAKDPFVDLGSGEGDRKLVKAVHEVADV